MQSRRVRRPAVAGQFYPADPHRLEATIAELLAQAAPQTDAPPKALIAPHAGYVGRVAAAAFACLRMSIFMRLPRRHDAVWKAP
jgi:AmmeMemoRadiSam system protein B